MRKTQYKDILGRWHAVLIPDDAPESHASMGIHLGPPDLEPLGLPETITTRLNNQLFWRGLLTFKEVRTRRQEVINALQAALSVDVTSIVNLYMESESNG